MWFFQGQQQPQPQHHEVTRSDDGEAAKVSDQDEDASVVSVSSTTAQNIDSILAKEMYAMSVQDRNASQEELHGVSSSAVAESPQLVWASHQRLKADLDLLVHTMDRNETTRQAFYEAYWLPDSQRYIKSENVCLKYLRADFFDVSKASQRMFTQLRVLHKYFGSSSLQRGLRYNDLSRQEQDILKTGNLQVLPSRDRTGRLISVLQGSLANDGLDVENRVRSKR